MKKIKVGGIIIKIAYIYFEEYSWRWHARRKDGKRIATSAMK